MQTCCTEILLANALPWYRQQCEKMQYMSSLKNSLIQAIRWLTILAGSYPPLERFIDGFCHGFANLNGLEERQLWLNPSYYWLAHKDGPLQTNQGYYWCPGPCWGHHWRGCETSWPPRLNCHRPGVAIHLEILVIAMLFPWHKAETLYRLPPTNGQLDQKAE